jgi:uncharacterized protein (DUF2147 family)
MTLLKKALVAMVMIALAANLFAAPNVTGLWKIIDDKTGKPTAIVMLYMYGGKMYGRIIATINKDTGVVDDTILTQKNKADKLKGNPPFCGLDIVYGMEDKGNNWYGNIIDPQSGDVYACNIWKEGNKLIVRGEIPGALSWMLGRNQTWLQASSSDLPAGFAIPNPSTFKPSIPQKK